MAPIAMRGVSCKHPQDTDIFSLRQIKEDSGSIQTGGAKMRRCDVRGIGIKCLIPYYPCLIIYTIRHLNQSNGGMLSWLQVVISEFDAMSPSCNILSIKDECSDKHEILTMYTKEE